MAFWTIYPACAAATQTCVYTCLMRKATGVCPVGNHVFTYEVQAGKLRTYCSPRHANMASRARRRKARESQALWHCSRCGESRAPDEFAGIDSPYCKPCMATWARERRARGNIQDPQYTRQLHLARYQLTAETFGAKLASQGGRCAICRTGDPGPSGWQLDHDHRCCGTRKKSCGKCLRGILCTRCNIGIGNLQDDPRIIQAALTYLLAHEGRGGLP